VECEEANVLCDLVLWGGVVNPEERFKVMI